MSSSDTPRRTHAATAFDGGIHRPPSPSSRRARALRATRVLPSRLAWRCHRTQAAIEGAQGLRLTTLPHLAARLAGGFLAPIDAEALARAVAGAVEAPLGALDAIGRLPGFRRAAARSLQRAWQADIDLARESAAATDETARERLVAMTRLERIVLARLPPNQRRAADLVAAARGRAAHAHAVFGAVELHEPGEVAPVWRPLVAALSRATELTWVGDALPAWLEPERVALHRPAPAGATRREAVSCATPHHEALEALRWARRLLAARDAPAHHVAIAAAAPEPWDDYIATLSESAELPVHFAHGRPALSRPAGQLCAALAEVLLHGLSRAPMVRLVALLREQSAPFHAVPGHWHAALPEAAPLFDATAWGRALDRLPPAPGGRAPDPRPVLQHLVRTLRPGLGEARHIGERLLEGDALALWDRALVEAPPAALATTLSRLRLDDGLEPDASIVWGPASTLAACVRPRCWLLGLTARAWPRPVAEDPLLPAHVVAPERLSPAPRPARDRADFHAFWTRTAHQLVCSRARRDASGRLTGPSPLYPRSLGEDRRRADRRPRHGLTPSDRLLGRPAELDTLARARSARTCWVDWGRPALTPHDGLIRPQHPVLRRALSQLHSPSSLATLLRDPQGFLWRTGFRWRVPDEPAPCLTLEPRRFGVLLHEVLARAVGVLEQGAGLRAASPETVAGAVETAACEVAARWERERCVPPRGVWDHTLAEAAALATRALSGHHGPPLPGQRSFAEVRFGAGAGAEPPVRAVLPWDPGLEVVVPGTGLRLGGRIDRLDLSGDGALARVIEYKTGARCRAGHAAPDIRAELQCALYAFAAHTLVPTRPCVQARRVHLRSGAPPHVPADPAGALARFSHYLLAAARSVADGRTLPGPGAGERARCSAFALPAGATRGYLEDKSRPIAESLAALAPLWEGR